MAIAARKLLRQTQLRKGDTPFDRLPWHLQRFVIDFLRSHLCEVTPANCQAVAAAVEYRLKKDRLLCPAELWVILEQDVFFD
ncbi:hypothetical protein [Dyella sp.]|jgi:hypothetical protein|uniref:hypothetical protein n=1 Tax=Dyella sp. TaxID=1869338 RepID=UPI002CAF3495|nr:hypothetical protein [Dyella sp.]HTC26463.1 hypothetical protein [Dyella sp.]